MALQYSTTHRTNAMSDIATQVGTSGVLKIFTGTAPANCATADTGTLLATLTCNATQFGTATSGVLTASAITSATASGTGTAGYFRIYPSAATTTNAVLQGTVGTTGADLNLSSVAISTGQTVSVTSMTITAFGA
ncbi:MAG: hypothetical protein KGL39_23715 [Patescibacteria group bacterium]|nr:hypothetical protein [Patescibacteria group bacterium]